MHGEKHVVRHDPSEITTVLSAAVRSSSCSPWCCGRATLTWGPTAAHSFLYLSLLLPSVLCLPLVLSLPLFLSLCMYRCFFTVYLVFFLPFRFLAFFIVASSFFLRASSSVSSRLFLSLCIFFLPLSLTVFRCFCALYLSSFPSLFYLPLFFRALSFSVYLRLFLSLYFFRCLSFTFSLSDPFVLFSFFVSHLLFLFLRIFVYFPPSLTLLISLSYFSVFIFYFRISLSLCTFVLFSHFLTFFR